MQPDIGQVVYCSILSDSSPEEYDKDQEQVVRVVRLFTVRYVGLQALAQLRWIAPDSSGKKLPSSRHYTVKPNLYIIIMYYIYRNKLTVNIIYSGLCAKV